MTSSSAVYLHLLYHVSYIAFSCKGLHIEKVGAGYRYNVASSKPLCCRLVKSSDSIQKVIHIPKQFIFSICDFLYSFFINAMCDSIPQFFNCHTPFTLRPKQLIQQFFIKIITGKSKCKRNLRHSNLQVVEICFPFTDLVFFQNNLINRLTNIEFIFESIQQIHYCSVCLNSLKAIQFCFCTITN